MGDEQAAARLAALVAHASDVLAVLDANGVVTFVSDNVTAALGWAPEHVVGTNMLALVHPQDAEQAVRSLAGTLAGEKSGPAEPVELRLASADGGWRMVEVVGNDHLDDPAVGGVVLNVRDLSERDATHHALRLERDFSDAVIDTVGALVLVLDPEGRIVRFNQACERTTGCSSEDVVGRSADRFLLAEERAAVAEVFDDLLAGHFPNRHENHWVAGDGTARLISWTNTALTDHEGAVTFVISTGIDVTDARASSLALARSEERLRTSLEVLLDGFAHYEAVRDDAGAICDLRLVYMNAAGRAMGVPAVEVGSGLLELRPAVRESRLFRQYVAVVEDGDPLRREVEFREDDGASRAFEVQAVRMGDGLVISYRDTTDRRSAEQRLAHQATHDALTGLPNRLLFNDRLAQAVARTVRGGQVALLFCDLDRFKAVNDTLGHGAGDELLVAVASRLRAGVRPDDTVARLGGDEFVVLSEGIDAPEEAEELAGRLERAVAEPVALPGGGTVEVTTSVGIAIGAAPDAPSQLLRDADAAMYRAKQRGRGRHEVFDALLRSEHDERIGLESGLRRALLREELRVVYQPLVDLGSGEVVGAEALLRWAHPERGLLGPGDFLPVAEEAGLLPALGRFVLATACTRAAGWRAGGLELLVAVNLSAEELRSPGLLGDVEGVLATTGLDPAALCLEVTERSPLVGQRAASDLLASLRRLGVSIALDDFGTGYSSLSHLRSLPISSIKIDRSFVQGLQPGRRPGEVRAQAVDDHVVASLVALGRDLGLDVVAEGIETPEQLERCRDLGCGLGQGYLLGTPAPPEELEERLGLRAGAPAAR